MRVLIAPSGFRESLHAEDISDAIIVLAGTLEERPQEVLKNGVCAFFSTVGQPETLAEAMVWADDEVALVAEHVRTFLAGTAFGKRNGG